MKLFARFAKCESGATAIEYGLMAALIGVAIIGTVTTVGTDLMAALIGVAIIGTVTTVGTDLNTTFGAVSTGLGAATP
jgi:pilus assembly protein Flp/PilA